MNEKKQTAPLSSELQHIERLLREMPPDRFFESVGLEARRQDILEELRILEIKNSSKKEKLQRPWNKSNPAFPSGSEELEATLLRLAMIGPTPTGKK